MISLLIPTRGRSQNIKHLFTNIRETVYNISNIEIIFTHDSGDELTYRSLAGLPCKDININFNVRTQSEYLNRDYYNWMAGQAKGKYLWAIGDDVRFETSKWDKILEEKIEEYLKDKTDRIAYISVTEVDSTAKHPCFPLITKEAFNFLNMYFHPELLSWGADRCLHAIYNEVGRVLHISEISIEHLSYHDGKAEIDRTALSMRERFFRDPNCHNKLFEKRIPEQIKKLKEYLSEKRVS